VKFNQKRLLFVDDEPGIRKTLPLILRRYGFQVTICATVAEALEQIEAHRFDILLCDLNIESEGDGYTVVRAVRQVNPDCVIIVLTGYPNLDTAVEGIHLAIDDYLVKPASTDTLVALVAEKLAARQPKLRILVISHDDTLLQTWKMLLQAKGYDVVALLGTRKLQRCKDQHFDLFLLGWTLSNAEKQQAIEAAADCCRARVISISANPAEESLGADYVVPPDPDAVLKAIAEMAKKPSAESAADGSASTAQQ
jgi:DNA-binding response OmpR family regulator